MNKAITTENMYTDHENDIIRTGWIKRKNWKITRLGKVSIYQKIKDFIKWCIIDKIRGLFK